LNVGNVTIIFFDMHTLIYVLRSRKCKKMIIFKYFGCDELLRGEEKMSFSDKVEEKALKNFENIKESIKGLYDVLNLGVSEELYHNAGLENLEGLYKNLLELLVNDYGLRKVAKKIQTSEVEVDITLDDYLVESIEKDI
jgi:hypothetical protein